MRLDIDGEDGAAERTDPGQRRAHFRPRHRELAPCHAGEFIEPLHADDTALLEQTLRYCRPSASRSPGICLLAIELPVGGKFPTKSTDARQRALAAVVSRDIKSSIAGHLNLDLVAFL